MIDAKFGPDGYPHYVHGFGERLSAARMVIKQVAAILDDLALARGLAKEIPLVLTLHRLVIGLPWHDDPGITASRTVIPGPLS